MRYPLTLITWQPEDPGNAALEKLVGVVVVDKLDELDELDDLDELVGDLARNEAVIGAVVLEEIIDRFTDEPVAEPEEKRLHNKESLKNNKVWFLKVILNLLKICNIQHDLY